MSVREAREVLGEGRVLVVYRWIADQFLAAVLLADWLGDRAREAGFAAFTELGASMSLVERVARLSRRYDAVALLGPGWKGPEIDLLAVNIHAPVLVVDNAYNRVSPRRPNVVYFNPSPRGDPRGTWPSVTFVLGTILGLGTSLLVAASIVALLGRRSIAVRAYQNSMARHGLSHISDYDIPEMCAMRAAGLTAMGDPGAMAAVPQSIVEASTGDTCRALLDDALLASYAGMLEAELPLLPQARLAEIERGGDMLLLLAARNNAFRENALSAAVRADRVCVWDPTRRSIVETARSGWDRGLRGIAVHQGLVNYACLEGRGAREWARLVLSKA